MGKRTKTTDKNVKESQIKGLIESFNRALFGFDVMIEVICEHYLMVDKNEFQKIVDDCAKARIEKTNTQNNLEKKEE